MTNRDLLHEALEKIHYYIKGKKPQITIAMSTILSKGHLLIEDHPGVGKTTLAKTLAAIFGMDFKRVQCTSDLLPGDLTGVTYFNQKSHEFAFRKGPIFTDFLLLDELNRAQPKTQSAFLEALEERQVTHDSQTYPLSEHYVVVATKNPHEEVGTFRLPVSQLDRFAASISLGYPDSVIERDILRAKDRKLELPQAMISIEQLLQLQKQVLDVTISDELLDEIQSLIALTRQKDRFLTGLSTRGAIALVRLTQAFAMLQGRDYAKPEDLRHTLKPVLRHRILKIDGKELSNEEIWQLHEETDPIT